MSESVMAEWEYSCDKCNWIHDQDTGCLCEKCQEHPVALTLEAYGNGQMMKIDCPKCGVSYDTNLDPIEVERASK